MMFWLVGLLFSTFRLFFHLIHQNIQNSIDVARKNICQMNAPYWATFSHSFTLILNDSQIVTVLLTGNKHCRIQELFRSFFPSGSSIFFFFSVQSLLQRHHIENSIENDKSRTKML